MILPENEWMSRGACVGADPDLWFPAKDDYGTSQAAKAICHGCEVEQQCMTYALANETHGIWGGTSERERKRLRRQRALERRKQNVA